MFGWSFPWWGGRDAIEVGRTKMIFSRVISKAARQTMSSCKGSEEGRERSALCEGTDRPDGGILSSSRERPADQRGDLKCQF
mmetsp:Transcript_11563/g.24389  ORF Transcript_11563/g.24389 Transcript_11563/m.24389 type:complete len:82 (+) Transcript_11563:1020-1265(+)